MKNNAKFFRKIIAVIGIALLGAGITRTSRADDGRDFADKTKFTKIDVPGAAGTTEAFGINPRGDIVGTYFAVSNNTLIIHGFLLSKGTFTNIDVDIPGALAGSTNAIGINPHGDIVGLYTDSSDNRVGFVLSHDTFTKINAPGSTFTAAQGINPQGDIVGFGDVHSFLLSKGKFTNIDVPGAMAGSTSANGINPQGNIVGNYSDSSGNGHGFLLSHGRFTTIDVPGASVRFGSTPWGINPQGDIVGFYSDGSSNTHGFLLKQDREDDDGNREHDR